MGAVCPYLVPKIFQRCGIPNGVPSAGVYRCGAAVSHHIQMKELPPSENLCQTYIAHFHRLLQRKAVIMAKFLVDNLPPK